MIDCTFCAAFTPDSDRVQWNQPLVETKNFVVVPSLGSLVEGWLLIVPKDHYISMGALPTGLRSEADSLEQRIMQLLRLRYAEPINIFEHGPSAEKHGTGCGVDHAHLHVVPTACDLLEYARPLVPASAQWTACAPGGEWDLRRTAYDAGQDYLYLKPGDGRAVVATCEDFGSQVFRRALSSYLGIEDEFNWRTNPRIEIVCRTIENLSANLAA
jgi:ATP adenylyltransferase